MHTVKGEGKSQVVHMHPVMAYLVVEV